MNTEKAKKKDELIGLGLVSGGLDSLTACLLIQLQGIKVIGLNFTSPFCQYNNSSAETECSLDLFHEKLGIEVHYLPLKDDFFPNKLSATIRPCLFAGPARGIIAGCLFT